MGIFRKQKVDNEQLAALRAEIDAMQQRLDAADHAKIDLESRVSTLGQSNEQLEARLGQLDESSNRLGEEIGSLSTTSSQLNERVELVGELSAHVEELAEQLSSERSQHEGAGDSLHSTPVPPPPPPPRVSLDDGELGDITNQLEDLSAAVAAHYTQLSAARDRMDQIDDLAERMEALDLRVTSVSTELANQFVELSNDIDQIGSGAQPGAQGEGAAAIEQLANEQARYEIQFRQDLAELADRLRRP